MARLEWVILTERTILEAHANTVSLISIVENVNLPTPPKAPDDASDAGPPWVPFRFYVNQQWTRSERNQGEVVETRAVLRGPDQKLYAKSTATVTLEGSVARHRVVGMIPAFPLVGEGEYAVLVQAKSGKRWRTVGQTHFTVIFGPELSSATH